MCSAWRRSAAGSPRCSLPWPAGDDIPDFAPELDHHQRMSRCGPKSYARARAERPFDTSATARQDEGADHTLVDGCWRNVNLGGRIVHCSRNSRRENPPPWRLPSRPDVDRQGRCLHHRFRGEPGRKLEERRRKAPAARDVAGLIRSIDYSATAAIERALEVGSDEHGKLARGA